MNNAINELKNDPYLKFMVGMVGTDLSIKIQSKPKTAQKLGISISTLERLMSRGEIEYFRIGLRRIVFSDQQIDDYLKRCRQNAPQIERISA